MINCRQCRSWQIEAVYGELNAGEREKFAEHLRGCPDCAVNFKKLSQTVKEISSWQRPEPEPQFWESYWEKLENRLEAKPGFRTKIFERWQRMQDWFFIEQRWSYRLAGAVALVLVGILLGKLFFAQPEIQIEPDLTQLASTQTRSEIQVRADRYLERSKVLLLGLINFEPETEEMFELNFSNQKKISRELVLEAGELKSQLSEPADEQLRRLVTDLEVVLLQIANLEEEFDLTGIQMIKSGVDRRGILLKINVEEMQAVQQKSLQNKKTNKKNKQQPI